MLIWKSSEFTESKLRITELKTSILEYFVGPNSYNKNDSGFYLHALHLVGTVDRGLSLIQLFIFSLNAQT